MMINKATTLSTTISYQSSLQDNNIQLIKEINKIYFLITKISHNDTQQIVKANKKCW